jgi:hypothetical protein
MQNLTRFKPSDRYLALRGNHFLGILGTKTKGWRVGQLANHFWAFWVPKRRGWSNGKCKICGVSHPKIQIEQTGYQNEWIGQWITQDMKQFKPKDPYWALRVPTRRGWSNWKKTRYWRLRFKPQDPLRANWVPKRGWKVQDLRRFKPKDPYWAFRVPTRRLGELVCWPTIFGHSGYQNEGVTRTRKLWSVSNPGLILSIPGTKTMGWLSNFEHSGYQSKGGSSILRSEWFWAFQVRKRRGRVV